MGVFETKKFIDAYSDGNPRILNYGRLDMGIYTVCDAYPVCRYYYIPNMENPEALAAQDDVIKKGGADFIVSWNTPVKSEDYVEIHRRPDLFRDYKVNYVVCIRRELLEKIEGGV